MMKPQIRILPTLSKAIWLLPLSTSLWVAATGVSRADTELSLQETIDRAVQRSTQVGVAEADLQASVERKRQAWTNVGPRLSASYTESRFDGAQVSPLGLVRGDTTKSGSLTLAQPITGLYAAVEYAKMNGLQADLSQESLKQAKRDAGYGAAESFLQAYQAQEQVAIAEASVAAAKSAFQDAQAMFRVGRLSQADQLKFELALSQAQTRLAQAKALRQVSYLALRQAIQLPDNEAMTLQKQLPKIPEVPADSVKPKLDASRSELRKADLGSEIAGFGKKLAYAKLVPNVSVFAKWDRNFGEQTLLSGPKDNKYYGVKLDWDVWTNGTSVFEIREASAQQAKADLVKQSINDAVQLDLTQAFENSMAAQESLRLARSAVAQADEVYRIDQLRFKNGQISATDLIRSESDRTTASGNLINAETQLLVWYLRLQKAAGSELPHVAANP